MSTCTDSGSNGPNVSDTDSAPTGIAFNTDGTKMFIVGTVGDGIGEYTCTTGFDVSSCTANNISSIDVTAQDPNAHDIAFNTDGTKMFIVGENLDNILEYTCTTGFLLSSCTYSGDAERFSVTNEDTSPTGIAFNSDGTKMFVTGSTGQDVNEYTVPTAFDVSSLTAPSSETSSTTGSGGSANKHNTKPSFGLDHKTHFQLIEGGFSFNNVPIDITNNFWTPFEKQSIKVGESNEFETKVFASQKLRVQEFLFGISVVGEAQKAELGVEIFYDYSGEIEKVRVIQKTDIVDVDSIQIENIKSKCKSDDSDEKCITTNLQMKFLEPLKDNVMAIKAIDFKGRSNITYLNDGFEISGDSLNPMKTMMIPGTEKYEGLIEITQTAKYSDIWVSNDGRAFEINEYGSSKLINQTIEDKIDTRNNLDRYHSEFTDYKETQIDIAIKELLVLCPDCLNTFADFDDSFSYELPEIADRIKKLAHLIEIEKQKATKVLDDAQLLITYPDTNIDKDNRPISIILAEERAMKKILADELAYLKQILAPKQ